MRKLRALIAAVAALSMVSIAPPAHATEPHVDQGGGVGSEIIKVDETMGQTFRAGETGTLNRISLLLAPCDARFCPPMTVDLVVRSVVDGDPTKGDVLGQAPTTFFDGGPTGTWIEISFETPIPIVRGQYYAFEIPALANGLSVFGRTQPIEYHPMQFYRLSNLADTGVDLSFLTWITSAPLPVITPQISYAGAGEVEVSWDAVDGATYYFIGRMRPDGSDQELFGTSGDGTTATVPHRPGETYLYSVYAGDDWGTWTGASNTTFRTPSKNVAPKGR